MKLFMITITSMTMCLCSLTALANHAICKIKTTNIPTEVMVGDFIYTEVQIYDIREEFVLEINHLLTEKKLSFELIYHDKNKETRHCFTFRPKNIIKNSILLSRPNLLKFKLGESKTIVRVALPLIPLEKEQIPFWQELLKTRQTQMNHEKMTLLVTLDTSEIKLTFSHDFMLKFRPKPEMFLIKRCYEMANLNEYFDVKVDINNVDAEIIEQKIQKYPNLLIGGKKYLHILGVPWNNPTTLRIFHPATWQGWQELEESISPSTMRDEIRLTRMLIQYCDTKDAHILKELKEWFADMNEVQHTVMAKSVFDRMKNVYGSQELLPLFYDFYKAIREYDISAKQEYEQNFLKKLD